MPSDRAPHEFPDVRAKLSKPTKQSAFEKQKAEAEAKRLREEAETAAVYQDFIKSFDREGPAEGHGEGHGSGGHAARLAPPGAQGYGGHRPGPGSSTGTSRRHFGAPNAKSGPGSLGPPPTSFSKKRSYQDMTRGGPRDRHDEPDRPAFSVPRAFHASDDEDEEMGAVTDKAEERAIARPTLRLVNLPLGTSQAAVKSLLPPNLTAEDVRFQTPANTGGSDKKAMVAIVTLSKETPANDIEAAVSLLQNTYLGFGHYLSLHRHLSSAVTSASALVDLPGSGSESHPFGAKPVSQATDQHHSRQREFAPRGFAPPSSYDHPMANVNRSSLLHVPVKPPGDIREVRLINKVIEQLLEHGPEFEALVMSRPEVQREEKWSWIWNARSTGGVWYRWRLWQIVTGFEQKQRGIKYVPVFEGAHAWKIPDERLPFEYTTRVDEFVSDSEYNTSDDEDHDGEANRDTQADEKEVNFLNPLEKAKLTHLLARLPPTMSKLRRGDIARVTTFAITHASRGVEEVVDMIVSNIEKPFALTMANVDRSRDRKDTGGQGPGADDKDPGDGQDPSAASLVALYVVSDILSASSASGVRHAWRFRQLFEAALRRRRVFEGLGLMAEKFSWGRMRAEKWKRSIGLVLDLWEGWCAFASENQSHFVQSFENPPSAKVEDREDGAQRKNKWKPVEQSESWAKDPGSSDDVPPSQKDVAVSAEPLAEEEQQQQKEEGMGGEPTVEDDAEGEPMEEDIEGEPIDEDDIEGQPIDDDDIDEEPVVEEDGEPLGGEHLERMDEEAGPHLAATGDQGPENKVSVAESKDDLGGARGADLSRPRSVGRKPRMRAADMFADSDGSDGT